MSRMCVFLFFSPALVLFQLQASSSADRPIAKETFLMTKYLPDVPGKEGVIETVLLSPGDVVPAHRHNADVFAYVLDGSIVTRLKGANPRRFTLAKCSTNRPPTYTSTLATVARRSPLNF